MRHRIAANSAFSSHCWCCSGWCFLLHGFQVWNLTQEKTCEKQKKKEGQNSFGRCGWSFMGRGLCETRGEMIQLCFTGSLLLIDYLSSRHDSRNNHTQNPKTPTREQITQFVLSLACSLTLPVQTMVEPLLLNLGAHQRSKQCCSKQVVGKVVVFEQKLLKSLGYLD